jgi:hypothetical protein
MKYFGPESLSSKMSDLLLAAKVIVCIGLIVAPIVLSAVIFFSTPVGEKVGKDIFSGRYCTKDMKIEAKDFEMTAKDRQDWDKFKNMPLAVKFLVLPYCIGLMILLLHIIKKAHLLFDNFKRDIVFHKGNVALISVLAKLLIVYGILTASFSLLLVSIVLFLLCEIIKDGSELKEELELTV